MQSLHSSDLVRYVAVQYFSPPVQSQECVQNLPVFENQNGRDVDRLQSGTQTIIPDYSFDCYGNVTHWGAYVDRPGPGEGRDYTLDFQVWRRSGGGLGTTGDYDFVGSNSFPSINPAGGGRIDRSVPVEDQIRVRPGDVIGLYITTSGDNGVELKEQNNGNGDTFFIWFATSLPAALSTRTGVGSTSGYELTSTTTAAPVITAVVVPSTPSPSQTPSPSSPGTSQTTQTLQTQVPVQLSAPSTPQPSSFLPPPDTTSPPVDSGLPVEAIVAIVIVVLIMIVLGVLILVFILTVVRRRRSKKQVLMVKSFNNPEYSGKLEIMH